MAPSGILSAITLAAVIFAACCAASPVHADTKILATAGSWDAFGGKTSSGVPVCGISADLKKRYFGVKFFSGGKTFTIQLGGQEWTIEKGTRRKVTMRFDTRPLWTATGVGMHFDDGDGGIQYDIRREELNKFKDEFLRGRQLVVQFPDSNVPTWTFDLKGTTSVSTAFETCLHGMK